MPQLTTDELKLRLNELYAGIIITDIDCHIVYANDSAVRIFKNVDSFMEVEHPFFNVEHQQEQNIDEIYNDTTQNEYIITIGDMSLSIRSYLIHDEQGIPSGYVGEFYDITESIQDKENLKLLNQQINLIQKNECLGKLSAGIAHDLNNILNCIIGFNELNILAADECSDDALKEEFMGNASEIEKAGKRAVRLIKNMMIYSRDIPDSPEIRPSKEVIEESIVMLKPAIGGRYQLRVMIEEYLDIQIDALELNRILTNLVINARDAMKNGGYIDVSLNHVHINKVGCTACSQILNGDFIGLCVSDKGTGIEKDILEHIFDPFFTTKDVGEGTGLGLSTVSAMVHKAEGHIIVVSEPSGLNHGTKFKLLFPYI